ncbi:MAG: hypothetical protein DRJ32_06900 [Thermoprotei archaeon]|nr:MAG: hypothetical protein DRJ32_06900 [Thermoprotei archaeon]
MGLQRSYALDTSVLIVYYYKRNLDDIIREGYINVVTLSETLYVICRMEGVEEALKYVEKLAKEANLVPSHKLVCIAGQFKCKYRISLSDAWTLATAKVENVPALYAIRKREIIDIIDRLREDVHVEFL